MIKANIKAFPENEMVHLSPKLKRVSMIGKALLDGKTVVGIFHSKELPGTTLYHVYKIKEDVLFSMLMLPNRDLHLAGIHVGPDDYYETVGAKMILRANETIHIDTNSTINVKKAYVPDSPNAEDIRKLLRA